MARFRWPTARSTSSSAVTKRPKATDKMIKHQGDRARQHRKPATSALV
jgi:hypothetical protein